MRFNFGRYTLVLTAFFNLHAAGALAWTIETTCGSACVKEGESFYRLYPTATGAGICYCHYSCKTDYETKSDLTNGIKSTSPASVCVKKNPKLDQGKATAEGTGELGGLSETSRNKASPDGENSIEDIRKIQITEKTQETGNNKSTGGIFGGLFQSKPKTKEEIDNEQFDAALATNPDGTPKNKYISNNNGDDDTRSEYSRNVNNEQYVDGSPCGHSKNLGFKNCDTTRGAIKTSQAIDAVGQIGGGIAVSVAGSLGAQRAASAGTQQAALKESASAAQLAGVKDTGLGAINVVAAMIHNTQRADHSADAETAKATRQGAGTLYENKSNKLKTLDDWGQHQGDDAWIGTNADAASQRADDKIRQLSAKNKNPTPTEVKESIDAGEANSYTNTSKQLEVADRIVDSYGLNESEKVQGIPAALVAKARDTTNPQQQAAAKAQVESLYKKRQANYLQKRSNMVKKTKQITGAAAEEQDTVAGEAQMAAITSGIKGLAQLTTGLFALKSAKELKAAAKNLETPSTVNNPNYESDPVAEDTANAARAGTTLGQNAAAEQATAEDDTADNTTDSNLDLGTGFNPDEKTSEVAGLPPGAFDKKAGDPLTGANAGGGGGGGAGSTSADMGSGAADNSAAYAQMGDAGGNYIDPGAGGGRRPSGSAAKGIDLSSMLGQLLGMGAKEESHDKNGILAFGARRGEESMLGPQENIFQRISSTYQTKSRKGVVGTGN